RSAGAGPAPLGGAVRRAGAGLRRGGRARRRRARLGGVPQADGGRVRPPRAARGAQRGVGGKKSLNPSPPCPPLPQGARGRTRDARGSVLLPSPLVGEGLGVRGKRS